MTALPDILFFSTGDLRQLFDLPPVQDFDPERFAGVETTIAASGMLAAAVLRPLVLHRRERQRHCCCC
ncbi:MAG: hypothetical protein IPM03_05095 [Sulfuritalea sp.]|nr:hypothetical protein [Sulfuritalea sp.]